MDARELFAEYRNEKIAIYGLSPLTEKLLAELDGYTVFCLLDGYRTSGGLYGKSIRSLEEAAAAGVRLIIAAARPESCKVIANRIRDVCRKHAIALLDIRGNDLCAPKKPVCSLADVPGVTKAELWRLIDGHDVISVDLFDTLLMRRTLFPADVYEIVGQRLEGRGIQIENFPKKRLEAEKELCKASVPTLLEIYTYLLERSPCLSVSPEDLTQLEWETDRDLTVPRRDVCEILEEVHRKGKPVCIVSDTFYTKAQLAELLTHNGFAGYTDIFASCEYRTGKMQRLFEALRGKIPGQTCLHIGDSSDTDIEAAERNGFDACQLYSGLDLLELAGYLGLWEHIGSLSSRIQLGMFTAKLFNSPFQFEEPERRLHTDSAYDVGYLFLGPLITGFVIWFYQQIQTHGLKNIWFCARDGYLVKQLYDQMDTSVNSVYFLTSRFAAIRAGLENEEDIRYVEEMRFSGSLQEQLRERFEISVQDCEGKHRLLDFKAELLEAAEANRKNYCTYIQSLNPPEGEIAFFDFVARGTVQMYVERMVGRRLRGFYFSRLDPDYTRMQGLDIQPFYEKENSGIYQNFYMLETIVTAPHPPVLGFGAQGEACYAAETRSESDLCCIQRVQDGIKGFFQTYRKLDPAWAEADEKPLAEGILSLISKMEIRSRDFLALRDEDPFFNRTTGVSELL